MTISSRSRMIKLSSRLTRERLNLEQLHCAWPVCCGTLLAGQVVQGRRPLDTHHWDDIHAAPGHLDQMIWHPAVDRAPRTIRRAMVEPGVPARQVVQVIVAVRRACGRR